MNILGLSSSIDASAALVQAGETVAASAQERFDRIKHSRAFPREAVTFCLEKAGLCLPDLDAVAFFWHPGRHLTHFHGRLSREFRHHLDFLFQVPDQLFDLARPDSSLGPQRYLRQSFHGPGDKRVLDIYYVTHHCCHAASAFYPSPFDRAAVLTLDGYGEESCGMIARGTTNGLEVLEELPYPHSLGAFYAAVTQYLGFQPNADEGKVMGLAAHGKPAYLPDFRELVRVCDSGLIRIDLDYFSYFLEQGTRVAPRFLERFGPPRHKDAPLERRHQEIAASAQAVLEEAVLALAQRARRLSGESALCCAGGVMLNSAANGALVRSGLFERYFFFPAAGDGGTSVGAALYLHHDILHAPGREIWHNDLKGPAWSNEQIGSQLADTGLEHRPCDAPTEAAQLLAAGKTVGWFQGAAELGPRALGARSILADPRDGTAPARLNSRVKKREAFRPYAPSVTWEDCERFFAAPHRDAYMLTVSQVRSQWQDALPAITHVDGSARVQAVAKEANPRFYALLRAFERLAGVPVLLNTSFNRPGEPIVNTVEHALHCFAATGLDALVLGDYVVCKP